MPHYRKSARQSTGGQADRHASAGTSCPALTSLAATVRDHDAAEFARDPVIGNPMRRACDRADRPHERRAWGRSIGALFPCTRTIKRDVVTFDKRASSRLQAPSFFVTRTVHVGGFSQPQAIALYAMLPFKPFGKNP